MRLDDEGILRDREYAFPCDDVIVVGGEGRRIVRRLIETIRGRRPARSDLVAIGFDIVAFSDGEHPFYAILEVIIGCQSLAVHPRRRDRVHALAVREEVAIKGAGGDLGNLERNGSGRHGVEDVALPFVEGHLGDIEIGDVLLPLHDSAHGDGIGADGRRGQESLARKDDLRDIWVVARPHDGARFRAVCLGERRRLDRDGELVLADHHEDGPVETVSRERISVLIAIHGILLHVERIFAGKRRNDASFHK